LITVVLLHPSAGLDTNERSNTDTHTHTDALTYTDTHAQTDTSLDEAMEDWRRPMASAADEETSDEFGNINEDGIDTSGLDALINTRN